MALAYNTKIVRDGLVLHLDAANVKSYPGSGTTWTDMSGNGNHGTNSGVTFSSNNGGYFTFDGTNDVCLIPNSPSLNPTTGLTIESWVKFDGASADFIFEKGNVNTQYSLFSHNFEDITFRTYHVGDGTYNSQSVLKTALGIVNGQWHHIVGSWDGTTKRIYVDGEWKHSQNKSGNLVTTTPGAAVGRFGGTSTGYYFDGNISKVAVYSRGLTAAEIKQNFAAYRGRYGV